MDTLQCTMYLALCNHASPALQLEFLFESGEEALVFCSRDTQFNIAPNKCEIVLGSDATTNDMGINHQGLQIEWNMSSMSTRQNTSPWTVSINIKCHLALVPASQAILNIQEGSLTYTPFATELKETHLPFFVVMHDRVYVLGNQFKTKPVLSTAITIGNFSPTSLFRKRTSPISRQSFHTVRTFYLMFTR